MTVPPPLSQVFNFLLLFFATASVSFSALFVEKEQSNIQRWALDSLQISSENRKFADFNISVPSANEALCGFARGERSANEFRYALFRYEADKENEKRPL